MQIGDRIRFDYQDKQYEGSVESDVLLSKQKVQYVRMLIAHAELKEIVPRSFHVDKMVNVIKL